MIVGHKISSDKVEIRQQLTPKRGAFTQNHALGCATLGLHLPDARWGVSPGQISDFLADAVSTRLP